MGKSTEFEYLDDERKKLWHKVNSVETALNERIDYELTKIPADYVNDSKQASKKASEYRNKSEESKNTIFQYLNESSDKLNEIKDVSESASTLNQKILSEASEAKENGDKIKNIYVEVESSKIGIENYIQKLEDIFEDFDTLTDKVSKLNDIVSESDDTSSKIETLHKSLLARKKEIDQLYYDIFGYKEEETKTIVKGLKDELENVYDELKTEISLSSESLDTLTEKTKLDYEAILNNMKIQSQEHVRKWETQYVNLESKIEALLPNALTAGLSSAYSDKKNVEIDEYNKLNKAFLLSIWGLVTVSLIPFVVSVFSLYHNKTFEQVLLDMPRLVLSILPLYIPVLWVAYSSNRKMNLSKRLSEEYSHKEVLSKTFEGLSNQINSISDQKISMDLKNKLLYNILEVSSENPGKLISDYNKSDHPLMDALDKSVQLATAFEKLGKIPGFAKLANKMNKKSNAILEEEDEKANKGLDSIDEED